MLGASRTHHSQFSFQFVVGSSLQFFFSKITSTTTTTTSRHKQERKNNHASFSSFFFLVQHHNEKVFLDKCLRKKDDLFERNKRKRKAVHSKRLVWTIKAIGDVTRDPQKKDECVRLALYESAQSLMIQRLLNYWDFRFSIVCRLRNGKFTRLCKKWLFAG